MIYQLYTGRAITISLDQYLNMTDDDFYLEIQDVIACNYGNDIDDPFFMSIVKANPEPPDEEDRTPNIDELSSIEKLKDLDLESSD